jgi:hypothetical protein
MKTPDDRKAFVEKLLSRDPPAPDELHQHQDQLLRRIGQRLVLYRVAVSTLYILLFLSAFGAYLCQQRSDSITHSILLGSVSTYILLWFLVWFLRGIYRGLAQLADTDAANSQEWRRQDRLITAVAIVVFAFSGLLLWRSFSLTDPLRVAHQAADCLWAAVFFVFWYPFGTASLLARVWLRYKRMELQTRPPEGQVPDNPPGPGQNP